MPNVVTTNTWASTGLPLPSIDYSAAAAIPTLRSPLTSGRIQTRRRWNTTYARLQVKWHFSYVQYKTFRTFYDTTLGNGAARFEMELKYPKNSALSFWVIQFLGSPNVTPISRPGIWEVTAQIMPYYLKTLEEKAEYLGAGNFLVQVSSSSGSGTEGFAVQGDGSALAEPEDFNVQEGAS